MPKVGKKEFPYTKAGKKAAKAYAKKIGKEDIGKISDAEKKAIFKKGTKAGPKKGDWRNKKEGKVTPPVKTKPNPTKAIGTRPWKEDKLATPMSDARKRSKKKY
jgi:hypothetical protein